MNKTKMNSLLLALFLLIPTFTNAESRCRQEIFIKNETGDLKIGAMYDPPKGSDYSVWFPILPRALAFDSQGNTYIGDSLNYRIMKFDRQGKFLRKITLQRPVRTKKPELSHEIRSIAVDKDDNIYVLNIFEYRVEIYSPSGKFIRKIDYFNDKIDRINTNKPRNKFQPIGVGVDAEGKVYLLGGKDRLSNKPISGAVYGPSGNLIKTGVARGAGYEDSLMVGATEYTYESDRYVPDKTLPGKDYLWIKIKDKKGAVIKECSGIDNLSQDEGGPAIYLDKEGNLYSFDTFENIIKIRAR